MDQFFNPQSIVIFGASSNKNKGGNAVTQNLLLYKKKNPHIKIFIVHPKRESIEGIKCHLSLDLLMQTQSDPLNLALIVLPIHAVANTVKMCIAHKVRGIVVESGEIADNSENDSAEKIKNELKALLKNSSTRLMGPNALGTYNTHLNLATSIGLTEYFLVPREKNVSLCGQSGLFITGFIYEYHKFQHFGIAKSCAIGNKFDVNESDILEYYLNDPQTDIIAMYLEDIRDGKRFSEILKNNAGEKPIVILKAGKTEQAKKAIVSHTGSLAGNFKIFEALANQRNIILVDNYQELFDCASVLTQCPPGGIKSNKIGVISISGSGCVLAADYCEKYGLELPELTENMKKKLSAVFPHWAPLHNPVDTWVSIENVGDHKSFNHILQIYLESGLYDAIIMATIGSSFSKFDFQFIHSMREQYPNVPIILNLFGGYSRDFFLRNSCNYNIPLITNYEESFKIYGKIWKYAKRVMRK